MRTIFISLSAFSDLGNDEELTKIDLRRHADIPNIDLDIEKRNVPDLDDSELKDDEVDEKYLDDDLNSNVSEATLELGKRPDRRTRYKLRRVAQMSVRYENNTMPNENI